MASYDKRCLLLTLSSALSQEEALQMHYPCGSAATGEIPTSGQAAIYVLHGPKEGKLCPWEGYLVSTEKARC